MASGESASRSALSAKNKGQLWQTALQEENTSLVVPTDWRAFIKKMTSSEPAI
jgi:hypothetical protein